MGEIGLAPLRLADAPELMAFEAENRAWFEAFVPPRPADDWRRDRLEAIIRAQLAGPDALYLVRRGGVIAGRINFTDIAGGRAMLGYRIGRVQSGRGLATRAVGLGLDAIRARGVDRVELKARGDNLASVRVAEKAGFDEIAAEDGWRRFRRVLDAGPTDPGPR